MTAETEPQRPTNGKWALISWPDRLGDSPDYHITIEAMFADGVATQHEAAQCIIDNWSNIFQTLFSVNCTCRGSEKQADCEDADLLFHTCPSSAAELMQLLKESWNDTHAWELVDTETDVFRILKHTNNVDRAYNCPTIGAVSDITPNNDIGPNDVAISAQ